MPFNPFIHHADFRASADRAGIRDFEDTPLYSLLVGIGGGGWSTARRLLADKMAAHYANDRGLDSSITTFMRGTGYLSQSAEDNQKSFILYLDSVGPGFHMNVYGLGPTAAELLNKYLRVEGRDRLSAYNLVLGDPMDSGELEAMVRAETYNAVFGLPNTADTLKPASILEWGYHPPADGPTLAAATVRIASRLSDDIDETEALALLAACGDRWLVVDAIAQTVVRRNTLAEAFADPLPLEYLAATR